MDGIWLRDLGKPIEGFRGGKVGGRGGVWGRLYEFVGLWGVVCNFDEERWT